MLLAIYQKMRLIREINNEKLNVARFGQKVDRIEKNIKNVQKFYASKIKRLEQMANASASIFRNGLMATYNSNVMLDNLMKNGSNASIWEEYKNGTLQPDEEGNYGSYTKEEMQAFNNEYNAAQYKVQYQQQQLQWYAQNNEQMIQAQKEMQLQALEDEQNAALEPLEYEQTMMELDKEASQDRLDRLQEEFKAYQQLASQAAKDSAPKFGLG